MKIGLVPMAAKPYHAGHDALVRLASAENDKILVFVSTSDRDTILGSDMIKIWEDYIKPTLPGNVEVQYISVPVTGVYKTLEQAEQENSKDEFSIYSDSIDIAKYKEQSLKKSAKEIYNDKRIRLRGIDRSSTVDVSGTEMRNLLASKNPKDKKKFMSLLPSKIQANGEKIYNILKKQTNENLLRRFINELLVSR